MRRRDLIAALGGVASFASSVAPGGTARDHRGRQRDRPRQDAGRAGGRLRPHPRVRFLDLSRGQPDHPADVIVIGSYCGTRVLAPIFTRGVKAVIATDAGIGKDEAGISGLKHGETIGVPVATIAVMSAETSNGRSTLLGEISRANAPARALGVTPGHGRLRSRRAPCQGAGGQIRSHSARARKRPVVVEETPKGRIWATPGTTAHQGEDPERRVCSGANSSRVFSDGVIRMGAKGSIANDAGIAKNNSAVEGVMILGERGIPAASVSTLSARLGEGLSTWNDGIISVVNAVAAARGVKVGMTAKEAARLMLVAGGAR